MCTNHKYHMAGVNFKARDASQWDGRWFPYDPQQGIDTNPSVEYGLKHPDLYDEKHGIKMGVASPDCDDAKVS